MTDEREYHDTDDRVHGDRIDRDQRGLRRRARKYNSPRKTDHGIAEQGAAPFDDGLPELIISASDPTATAKELAALIAERDDFLFNGHAAIHVVAEADCLPRAL